MTTRDSGFGAFEGILQIWRSHRHHNLVFWLLKKHSELTRDEIEAMRLELADDLDSEAIESAVSMEAEQRSLQFEFHRRDQMLASLFGLFEHTLTRVSQAVIAEKAPTLAINDFNGNGIERAKTVLMKLGGVANTFQTKQWKTAGIAREIRNKVMHAGGLVEYSWDRGRQLEQEGLVAREDFGDGSALVFLVPMAQFLREF